MNFMPQTVESVMMLLVLGENCVYKSFVISLMIFLHVIHHLGWKESFTFRLLNARSDIEIVYAVVVVRKVMSR